MSPFPCSGCLMAAGSILVNRTPVLTLWAAVVAERLGFDADEALTLGRAVAGLNAHAKEQRIGVFKPYEERAKAAREKGPGEQFLIEVGGREVPAVVAGGGVRAVSRGRPLDPDAVRAYLADKFGDALPAVRAAMRKLAKRHPPAALAAAAYPLYERFRPAVPAGKRGWGAKGALDLDRVAGAELPATTRPGPHALPRGRDGRG